MGTEYAPNLTLPQRARDEGRLPLAPSRGFAVQRAAQAVDDSETESTDSPTDDGAVMVQGAWYESRVGVSRLPAIAAAPGTSTPDAAVAAPGAPHQPETDMDELAGKLYDRIRSRLKTELLVDRERAGFLTDLR
jgi:hypothetical protein